MVNNNDHGFNKLETFSNRYPSNIQLKKEIFLLKKNLKWKYIGKNTWVYV